METKHPYIHSDSHLDHNLEMEHLEFIKSMHVRTDGIQVTTFTMPRELKPLPCGLHGPIMGDAPVAENEVHYAPRNERVGDSRLVFRPRRLMQTITLVTGPHDGHEAVLFTAYGGPAAPQEPFELVEGSDLWKTSKEFWSKHALSDPGEGDQ